jgi:hypothetical protein
VPGSLSMPISDLTKTATTEAQARSTSCAATSTCGAGARCCKVLHHLMFNETKKGASLCY